LNFTLTSPATSFTWLPVGFFTNANTFADSPTITTIYTVAASDGTCFGFATKTAIVNPNPTITLIPSSTAVCVGNVVTYSATGGVSYTWNPGPGSGSTMSLTAANSLPISVIGRNTFSCTMTVNDNLIVNPLPAVFATADKTICPSETNTLTATGTANQYGWSNGVAGTTIAIAPANSTLYVVTGTNNTTGCTKSTTVNIAVFHPTLSVSPSTTICKGTTITLNASGAPDIYWDGSWQGNTYIVSPTSETIYTVTGTVPSPAGPNNTIFCMATQFVTVGVNPQPTVDITLTNTILCRTDMVTLTATGANSYQWTNGPATAAYMFTVNTIGPQAYTVTGTSNGCSADKSFQFTVGQCLGLTELEIQNVKVYPNPSKGSLYIQTTSPQKFELFDLTGRRLMMTGADSGNNNTAEIHGLSSGIYILKGMETSSALKIVVE
jgi:hypothetical protein